jgi:hypothetical protein
MHQFGDFKTVAEELSPIAPPPPICTSSFPSDKWSFDEQSRVLLMKCKSNLEATDLIFLLQMMERDDITVVTEGFSLGLNPDLWRLSIFEGIVGNEVCHQFRVFTRNVLTLGGVNNTEQSYYEYFEEQGHCCSMSMQDYVRYIRQRNDQLKSIKRKTLLASHPTTVTLSPTEEAKYRNDTGECFAYISYNNCDSPKGTPQTFNCIDTVLYLIDYDLGKFLPVHHDDFMKFFIAPQLLPGSQFCLMHEVSLLSLSYFTLLCSYVDSCFYMIHLFHVFV